jgi:hypothetical protein
VGWKLKLEHGERYGDVEMSKNVHEEATATNIMNGWHAADVLIAPESFYCVEGVVLQKPQSCVAEHVLKQVHPFLLQWI